MALVAYRDRGDAYVTQREPLTDDIDAVYAELQQFAADGGGDTPESVNQALHEAVTKLAWSQDADVYRAIFLVGDAPPHLDYQDDVEFGDSVALARQKGIVINTVQCGAYGRRPRSGSRSPRPAAARSRRSSRTAACSRSPRRWTRSSPR